MIEFQLGVDSRIFQAILPKIEEYFASSSRMNWEDIFTCPNNKDIDFAEAWVDSLKEDCSEDRRTLARVFTSPKFKYGQVEIADDEVDGAIRGISEIRLAIRMNALSKVDDHELETGDFDLDQSGSSIKLAYFAYLVLAEMQEKLIENSF